MDNAALEILKLVPRNAFSRGVGRLTRGPWPRAVHQAAIRAFVKAMAVSVEEAELPLSEYATFSDFFVRRLRQSARPLDDDPGVLVSPCDGALGAAGPIESGMLLQAKGRSYRLEAFLGDASWTERYEGGRFLTIYLAPFDYHRVHFPADGRLVEARHIPGTLWPVNPPAVQRVADLFAVNERLVTHILTDAGPVCVVMVGATCVGRMRMLFDEGVTNDGTYLGHRRYDPAIEVEKGDELGVFEMGSTVVLLTAPGGYDLGEAAGFMPRVEKAARRARRVLMGQAIGRRP